MDADDSFLFAGHRPDLSPEYLRGHGPNIGHTDCENGIWVRRFGQTANWLEELFKDSQEAWSRDYTVVCVSVVVRSLSVVPMSPIGAAIPECLQWADVVEQVAWRRRGRLLCDCG